LIAEQNEHLQVEMPVGVCDRVQCGDHPVLGGKRSNRFDEFTKLRGGAPACQAHQQFQRERRRLVQPAVRVKSLAEDRERVGLAAPGDCAFEVGQEPGGNGAMD
jgi:hypothetical protein